jgi:hypothetical protein
MNNLVLSQQSLSLILEDDSLGFPSMDFKRFYIQPTEGELNDEMK